MAGMQLDNLLHARGLMPSITKQVHFNSNFYRKQVDFMVKKWNYNRQWIQGQRDRTGFWCL